MQKILVTGGSGFIGGHLVEKLVQLGLDVTSIDIKPPVIPSAAAPWHHIDILDVGSLSRLLTDIMPDTVIHLAAKAEISSQNLSAFESIHIGTRNLLQACQHMHSVQHFVNISTQLVVGPGLKMVSDKDYRPYTAYGEAKAIAEGHLQDLNSKFSWVNLRPTNIWGPHHPSFANSIWHYIEKGYYLHPTTDEPVLRCYGYVKNTVDQIIEFAKADRSLIDRKTFYLADSILDSAIWLDAFSAQLRGKSCRRVPGYILKALGCIGDWATKAGVEAPINSGRYFRMTTSYPVPLDSTVELCGKPKISLELGVAETVAWLKSKGAKQ